MNKAIFSFTKSFLIQIPLYYALASTPLLAKQKIYQWTDKEGIRQFTTIPPPKNCTTESCIAIHQEFKDYLNKNRDKIKRQNEDHKRQQQRLELKATTLFKGEVICSKNYHIKEYFNQKKAQKYLIKKRKCHYLVRDTKYSFVEADGDFSKVRLYLKGDKSITRWVKSELIVIPQNKKGSD